MRRCRDCTEQPEQAPGLLIAGDFGSGKSHLLEHLHHLALEQNFVSSKVVISKETPLYDPVKLYRAAIDAAVVPNRQGSALREIAQDLEKAPQYGRFFERVISDKGDFDTRFGATLQVYDYVRTRDLEQWDRVISFWSGHKLNTSEIKRYLRQSGNPSYRIGKITAKELALQSFRFAAELMVTAGYSGWILLIDETELIGRYSLLQRAKSYAELARWMGELKDKHGVYPGIAVVFTITPDFEQVNLVEKNDLEKIPARLQNRGADGDPLLEAQAKRGMKLLKKALPLNRLEESQIEAVGEKLREVYARAYCWSPPPAIFRGEFLTSGRMRTYIRAWINQWDLERLYPNYQVEIEATELQQVNTEDRDLETPSESQEDERSFG